LERKTNKRYIEGVRFADESSAPLKELPRIIDDKYCYIGQLVTTRTRFSLPSGTNIDFDVSQYLDVTDYEIEVELGKSEPEEFLAAFPIGNEKPVGKYSRFVQRLQLCKSLVSGEDEHFK
jgi:uncharacterized protein YjbK